MSGLNFVRYILECIFARRMMNKKADKYTNRVQDRVRKQGNM